MVGRLLADEQQRRENVSRGETGYIGVDGAHVQGRISAADTEGSLR